MANSLRDGLEFYLLCEELFGQRQVVESNPTDGILPPVTHQQKVMKFGGVPEFGAIKQHHGRLRIESEELMDRQLDALLIVYMQLIWHF